MFPSLNKQPTSLDKQSFIKKTKPFAWLTGSALLLLAAIPLPATAQTVLFDETFAKPVVDTPTNFNYGIGTTPTGSSDPPCLTAANPIVSPPTSGQGVGACPTDTTSPTPPFTPDPAGAGTLRLTPSKQNQAAFVLVRPVGGISSTDGLVITFDFFSYNGSGTLGADGISFFLIDATNNPVNAGAFGGSLGYANRIEPNGLPLGGVVGGYVGVGFDEFGNYSNGNEGRNGGSPNPTLPDGRVPDAVAVRGSQASGYRYISGTTTLLQSIDQPNAINRLSPGVQRTAKITLTPNNQISVQVDFKDGAGFVTLVPPLSLNTIPQQGNLPPTLNFGFAGSTGTSTNIHEIQNLKITTIPPDLNIVKTGPPQFTVGTPGTYTLKCGKFSFSGLYQ